MLLFVFIFAGLFFSPAPDLYREPDAYDYCHTDNFSWQGGEEVTYKLYYQLNFIWIPAGEATFKVKDVGDRYYISIDGKTISAFEWFYTVRDHYESVIDKASLLPYTFERNIHEGKYQWWDRFLFDQKNNTVQASKGWPNKPTKYYNVDLSGCMHDMVSIIYNVRNLNFDQYNVGDKFNVKVFVEEEYPLEVEVREKNVETKIHNLGRHMTNLIRPQVVTGHFFNKDTRMDVYVSADSNHIPLMIESPVSVGKVKAVLTDYKGLRYPLAGK
jgi:hypothetical protein